MAYQIECQFADYPCLGTLPPEAPYGQTFFNSHRAQAQGFVARHLQQTLIEEQLRCRTESRTHKLLVIHGLGGAGKYQLALRYLNDHSSPYTARFWIEAGSQSTIDRDFKQIYNLLFLYDRSQWTCSLSLRPSSPGSKALPAIGWLTLTALTRSEIATVPCQFI